MFWCADAKCWPDRQHRAAAFVQQMLRLAHEVHALSCQASVPVQFEPQLQRAAVMLRSERDRVPSIPVVTMNIIPGDVAPMSCTSYLAAEDSLNAQAARQWMTGKVCKTECKHGQTAAEQNLACRSAQYVGLEA